MPKCTIKVRAIDRRSGIDVAHTAARILAADFVANLVLVDKLRKDGPPESQEIIFASEIRAICASVVAQGRGKPKRKARK